MGIHCLFFLYLPGSVRQKAATCSPEDNLGRYFFFWASFPAIRIPCKISRMLARQRARLQSLTSPRYGTPQSLCVYIAHPAASTRTYLEPNGLMCSQCHSDGTIQGGDLCQPCVHGVGQAQTAWNETQKLQFSGGDD